MANIAEVQEAFVYSSGLRARRSSWPEGLYIASHAHGNGSYTLGVVDSPNTSMVIGESEEEARKLIAEGFMADDWFVEGSSAALEHRFYEERKINDALRYCELQHSQGAVCAAVLRLLRGKVNPAVVNAVVIEARVKFKHDRYPNQPWIIDKLVFEAAEVHDHVKRELVLAGFSPADVATDYRELAKFSDTFTGWLLACDTAVNNGLVKPLPANYIEAAVAKAPGNNEIPTSSTPPYDPLVVHSRTISGEDSVTVSATNISEG